MADANKDTGTDPAGGSRIFPPKTGAPDGQTPDRRVLSANAPTTPAEVPEPTIIEETITRPAAPKPGPQPIVPPPLPSLPQETQDLKTPTTAPHDLASTGNVLQKEVATNIPPLVHVAQDAKAAPVTLAPKVLPAPLPIPSPAKAEVSAPLIGGLIPPELKSEPELVSVSPSVAPAPSVRKVPLAAAPVASPPEGMPTPAPIAAKPGTGARPDIEHLLEDIKLPERRDSPNTGSGGGTAPVHTYDTSLAAALGEEKGAPQGGGSTEVKATLPEEASLSKTIPDKASPSTAPLHTLKSDLQEIVRVKKVSLVSAVALEQDKRRRSATVEANEVPRQPGRTFGVLFAAILLIGLGAAAIFGVYIIMQERAGTTPGVTQGSSILFAESTVPLPLTNLSSLDLKRLLAQVRAGASATLGSITNIVPVASAQDEQGVDVQYSVSLEEFLAALGTRTPPDLLRALGSEFFFGLHTVDENAPILVIPVTSYERAFAGMLAWESTMNADLSPFFTPVPDQIAGPGGLPQKRPFEDIVMRNYDVRALKDDAGAIQLYYSFPTRELLVIGESPYSFTEVLSRLRAERKL